MIEPMMMKNVVDILKLALSKQVSIEEASSQLGFSKEYWLTSYAKIEAAYYKGTIEQTAMDELKRLFSEYESQVDRSSFSNDDQVVAEIEYLSNEITKLSPLTKNDPDRRIQYLIGEMLVRLKDLLSGNYIEYVEANLPFSQRTARSYTRIFFDMGGTYESRDGNAAGVGAQDIRSFLSERNKLKQGNPNPVEVNVNPIVGPSDKDSVDEYDDRSHWSVTRNDKNEIISYNYYIHLRDRGPLRGTLTTQQMEEIYRKYPYVTQATVSQDFPFLTFAEFRKILLCFNITKDRLFPQHIIEKYSEEELAEFALKAKESAGMKRMVEKKSQYFEKRFKETQGDIFQLQEERNWIDGVINHYFNERENSVSALKFNNLPKDINTDKKPRLYCLMSDLHIGKRYDHPLYGRGYNKDIASERFEQMAEHICKRAHEYENLTILCGGDITESIMENGLHNGIHRYMDLFQEDQIFYAVDLFHKLFATIIENTNFKSIELLGLEGNHDRIGVQRHDDKNRTAAKIIYKILEREWANKIDVVIAREGILNEVRESICLISHHGDSNLAKRKGEELVNLFGRGKDAYHLVLQGHFHHLSCKEGTNFVTISLPSVCSADTYSITEFAQNAQPGFLLGHQSEYGVGFDFQKITLY